MALVLLGLCAAKFLAGYSRTHDVSLFDETWSLVRGVELCRFNFSKLDYEPAYQLWYAGLSHLIPNRVQLFYANFFIILTLGVLLLYVLLRINRVPVAYALAAPVIFLGSTFVRILPWNAYFALTLVLGTLIGVSLLRERKNAAAGVLTLGLLLTTLVRPEFFLPSAVAVIYGVVLAIRTRQYRFLAAQLVPFLLVVLCFGLPGSRTERGWIAFQQHYALRLAHERHLAINSWLHAPMLTDSAFPGAHSLGDALRIDAPAVVRYWGKNLYELPGNFARLVMSPGLPHWVGWLQVALFALLVLWGLFAVRAHLRDPLTVAMGCFLLAPAVSVTVIFPRDHYLIIPCAILLALPLIWRAHQLPTPPLALTGLLALLLLAYTPNSTRGFCLWPAVHPTPLPVRETIATLQAVHARRIVEIDGGYGVYLPGTHSTLAFQTDRPFLPYLTVNNVDTVVVSWDMLHYDPLVQDAGFQYFLRHYAELGYAATAVAGGKILVLHKSAPPA